MATAKITGIKASADRAGHDRAIARGEYSIRVTAYSAERRARVKPAAVTVVLNGVETLVRPVIKGATERLVCIVPAHVSASTLCGTKAWSKVPADLQAGVMAAVRERDESQAAARQADALASLVKTLEDARRGLELAKALPAGMSGPDVWRQIRGLARALKAVEAPRTAEA